MAEVEEAGTIFFVYRPKVEREDAHGLDDVERFHLVLRPDGRRLWRLLVVGRKRLPDVDAHERNWGFVERVLRDPAAVRDAFGPATYATKTRGERHLAAARPAGEGSYALLRDGRQVFLAYRLELPREPGPVQEAFNILPEAAYALSIKNPKAPGAALLGENRAHLPRDEQSQFRGRRFEGESAAPLDHEGVELLLAGARRRAGDAVPEGDGGPSALLKLLRAGRERTATEPLLDGVWA